MMVCDKCRKEISEPVEIKVKGMIFDYCENCAERAIRYLKDSEKKGWFGGASKILE